jgi:hypothetical protein
MRKLLLAVALLAAPTLSAAAAENPWIGTWKLDPARSQMPGTTIACSKAANGLMHYVNDGGWDFDFGIDGKEYKTATSGYTDTWTAAGTGAWDTVVKRKGSFYEKMHHQLSADGKTLTLTETGTRPDGSSFTAETVYTRESGSAGLEGKWRSVKASATPNTFVIAAATPDGVRWTFPVWKESVTGKADGSDLPLTGSDGAALSIKLDSPRRHSFTIKVDGKPVEYDVDTLSADGTSFTEITWLPGKESEKVAAVYVKQ